MQPQVNTMTEVKDVMWVYGDKHIILEKQQNSHTDCT